MAQNNDSKMLSIIFQNELFLNILVGCAMMALSAFCLIANYFVIKAIFLDKNLLRQNCYKFMLALCLVDCAQSFVHFITGFFTIDQRNFNALFSNALGVIATPSYVFYAIITIVLAINRLLVISSSDRLETFLFSSIGVKLWFALPAFVALSFALALSSPWAAISYSPDQFSWAYDESRQLSHLVQSVEEIIEIGGIPMAGLIYTAIFFTIFYKRINGLVLRQTSTVAEVKVLIQAFSITAYCTVLNYFWHNSEWLLPDTKMAKCALNFMWIGNGAVNPLIYFAVNAAIRQRISAVFVTSPNLAQRNLNTNLAAQRKVIRLQNNFINTNKF